MCSGMNSELYTLLRYTDKEVCNLRKQCPVDNGVFDVLEGVHNTLLELLEHKLTLRNTLFVMHNISSIEIHLHSLDIVREREPFVLVVHYIRIRSLLTTLVRVLSVILENLCCVDPGPGRIKRSVVDEQSRDSSPTPGLHSPKLKRSNSHDILTKVNEVNRLTWSVSSKRILEIRNNSERNLRQIRNPSQNRNSSQTRNRRYDKTD
jgi:hypothetical protein